MKYFTTMLLAMFLLSGCVNSQSQQKAAMEDVDAKRFKELVDSGKGIILDVRTTEEVADGHIPNSINIDFQADDFEQQVSKLGKDKEVYVYCQGGGRSSDASRILLKNGFSKVYNLEDGFSDWQRKGMPVVKD
jgi:rhodanese-related sulfurtransferase